MAHYALPLGAALDAHLVGVLHAVIGLSTVAGIVAAAFLAWLLTAELTAEPQARAVTPPPTAKRLPRPTVASQVRETEQLEVVRVDPPARLGDPELAGLVVWPPQGHTAAPEPMGRVA